MFPHLIISASSPILGCKGDAGLELGVLELKIVQVLKGAALKIGD